MSKKKVVKKPSKASRIKKALATADNPNHYEDFHSLLQKMVKTSTV